MEPRTIGPYRIEDPLGTGGMGEVYRAYDDRLDRRVAIKIIRASVLANREVRRRFRREAKAAASLSHPAIVQIHDILESERGDSIVMELVDGQPLSRLLDEQGPLEIPRAVSLVREIADGLAAAHTQGVIHRDLKADNVMVTASGHAKILDFGLAKRLVNEDTKLSVDGKILGTVHAMSPEQAQGFEVDARSDLFSLGSLLYQMVTCRSPFKTDSPMQTLTRITSFRQTPANEVNPGVPAALSDLIDRLLEKDPAHRPETAGDVVAALEGIAANSTGSNESGTPNHEPSSQPGDETLLLPSPGHQISEPTPPTQAPHQSPGSSPGAVLKTLLVSDLVDSTRWVELLGDQGAAALFRRHDRLARDLLVEYEGREVDKTDGFLLLFERPINAVLYSQRYHQALAQLAIEARVELAARVGIHLGEVVLHVNTPQDVARGAKPLEVEGLAKPIAARLMSLAEGRQTLMTQGAFDTARRGAVGLESIGDLRWIAHGSYRIKGIEEPLSVFEVGRDGSAPLTRPQDSDKASWVAFELGGKQASRRRLSIGALSIALLLLALFGIWRLRPDEQPLYVAVLAPQISVRPAETVHPTETVPPPDIGLVASAVRLALIQALVSRHGISTPAPDEVDAVTGTSKQVADALGVDEVITSSLTCDAQTCQIVLQRVQGADGNVRWTDLFEVSPVDLLDLTSAVTQRLNQGYREFSSRPGARDLQVTSADYETYLHLRRSWETRAESTSPTDLLVALTRLQATSPGFTEAYLLEARIAQGLFIGSRRPEDLERALGAVQRARESSPGDSRPLFELFNIAFDGHRLELAESALEGLRRAEPGHGRILAQQALLLEARGQSRDALTQLRTAVERHASRRNLTDLARMEILQGEHAAARETLHELLRRSPDNTVTLFQLANFEMTYGSLERAIELLEKLRAQSPTDLGMRLNIALCHFGLARYAEAARGFASILEHDPIHIRATSALALTHFLNGQESAAQEAAKTALELSLDAEGVSDVELQYLRAMALIALGSDEQAVAAIQRMVSTAHHSPFAAWQTALIYAAVGEILSAKTKAREALQQGLTPQWFGAPVFEFLRQDPDFRDLPQAGVL